MTSNLKYAMQEAFGVSEAQLLRLIARAPHAYKIYTIPKKSGGVRTIAQPAKETKFLQRWLIDNIFKTLPVHKSAVAYKVGASIKKNASQHKENQYISKFDFKNFFTSIKEKDLVSHLTLNIGKTYSAEDIKVIARLSCISDQGRIEPCLSIGAPSSPILSNSVMFEFDCKIDAWCSKNNVTYTRYADDLTFSTNEKDISYKIEQEIRNAAREIAYPRLFINNKKTTYVSKKCQRRVTGVVINNEGEISLGREKKRSISTLIHRFSLNLLSDEEIFNLQGLLGFAKDIEPIFVFRMRKKYGSLVIDSIFQIRKPSS